MRVRFTVYGSNADELRDAATKKLLIFSGDGDSWDWAIEASPNLETVQGEAVSWMAEVEAWTLKGRTS